MPYPNEHAARIIAPEEFRKNSFRRTKGGRALLSGAGMIEVPKSISIIWGKLSSDNRLTVQALRFPIEYWTADEAKKWLKKNNVEYILFEPAQNKKQ